MEQSPFWEANRSSASQEIPRILWNSEAHYRIYELQAPALSWNRTIQFMPPHPTTWRYILILSSHLRLGLSTCLFHSDFPIKTLYAPLLSPTRATCHAHVILLDLITRIIFDEDYRP
jgi:hypothetical protein